MVSDRANTDDIVIRVRGLVNDLAARSSTTISTST